MRKLVLWPRNSFSGNICLKFSVLCLCSVLQQVFPLPCLSLYISPSLCVAYIDRLSYLPGPGGGGRHLETYPTGPCRLCVIELLTIDWEPTMKMYSSYPRFYSGENAHAWDTPSKATITKETRPAGSFSSSQAGRLTDPVFYVYIFSLVGDDSKETWTSLQYYPLYTPIWTSDIPHPVITSSPPPHLSQSAHTVVYDLCARCAHPMRGYARFAARKRAFPNRHDIMPRQYFSQTFWWIFCKREVKKHVRDMSAARLTCDERK